MPRLLTPHARTDTPTGAAGRSTRAGPPTASEHPQRSEPRDECATWKRDGPTPTSGIAPTHTDEYYDTADVAPGAANGCATTATAATARRYATKDHTQSTHKRSHEHDHQYGGVCGGGGWRQYATRRP